MTAAQMLTFLLLCALLGAVGQIARVVVGLKKLRDAASASDTKFADQFEASRLVVSLIIGGAAGVLGGLALTTSTEPTIDTKFALGLMAAGYAGADFIEGFMSRQGSNLGAPTETRSAILDTGTEIPPVG